MSRLSIPPLLILLFHSSFFLYAQENENDQLLFFLNRALDTDSSKYYFRKAESIKEGDEQEGIYHYYMLLFHYDNGRVDSAKIHGLEGLKILEEVQNVSYKRRINHQLMLISRDQGLLDDALNYCLTAYELVVESADTAQIVRYLTERAFIHHDFEQYELGVESGKEALKLWTKHSESVDRHKLYILNAIAINFDDWNKPDSALACYDKILAIESMKGSSELGPIYNNKGNTLMKQGNYDRAYKNLKKSYDLQKNERGDYYYYDLATVINNLGTIQSHFQNWDSAQYYLDLAEVFADSSNSFEKKKDNYFAQFQLAETKGNFKKALDYQSSYFAIRDSIFQKDRASIIARMEAEFETVKKEQQISVQNAQLEEQKAIIERNRIAQITAVFSLVLLLVIGWLWRNRLKKKQQLALQEERLLAREAEINATISSQEKERARYARDLHDGFGQMISILNMNLGNLKSDAKREEREKVYEESEKVINEMYDELKGICFDLMPQTLVKNGLQSGLEEFAERINTAGKIFIETNFFGLEPRLAELQEISLYRISQEWINNILKYSNADKITLQITKDEEEITLLIEDNGAGFDRSLLTDSQGNGWKNLNTRTNLINGQLELETEVGKNGNTLIVNAPSQLKLSQATTLDTVPAS